MTLGQLNSLLARVAEAQSPEYRDRAWNEIVDEFARMKREWIDPQRIVDLAKRYTDQNRIGYVELSYYDHDDREPQWQIIRSGGAHEDARTANEALKMMEAEA